MKELTIEQKAKAYDIAVRKVNDYREGRTKMYNNVDKVIDYLFPEIAESEDERIRKEIIHFLEIEKGQMTPKQYNASDKWVAWLKKQGKKDILEDAVVDSNEDGLIADTIRQKSINWKKGDILSDGTIVLIVDSIGTFEGETIINSWYFADSKKFYGKGPEKCDKWYSKGFRYATNAECNYLFKMIHEAGYEWDPKRKELKKMEQKPTDKVEPKFKIGDWLINPRTSHIIHIKDVLICDNKGVYELENSSMSIKNVEDNFRLWTIRDAKDGDVLAFKNNICGIIICKSPADYDTGSYCRLVSDLFIDKEEDGWNSTLLCPATKEQSDLLFQKIKEAGYEWDVEKKELKKTEKKPILDIEIPYGAKDSELVEVSYHIPDGYHAEINGSDVVIKPGEQKPAWSEEDDINLENVIWYVEKGGKLILMKTDKLVSWLKSLKDKVQPKSNWSEKDKENISMLIDLVEAKEESMEVKIELLTWLMFLKGRVWPKQEWNKEDEKIYGRIYDLIHAAAFATCNVDEDGKELGEYAKITSWFKSLKERCV